MSDTLDEDELEMLSAARHFVHISVCRDGFASGERHDPARFSCVRSSFGDR